MKNNEIWLTVDKVIAIIERMKTFGPQVYNTYIFIRYEWQQQTWT